MRLINRKLLVKLKVKNQGNRLLLVAIDGLIKDICTNSWRDQIELRQTRPDADRVHSDGFFFFDLTTFRVMMLLEFSEGEVTVVWAGSHQEYERVFRNNKKRIKTWLKSNEWI